MPSSLAVIHSSTSGFSPRPPVSVYGTGGRALSARSLFWLVCLPALSARPEARGTVPVRSRYAVQPGIPSPGGSVTPRSRADPRGRLRNVDRRCIAVPLRVRLSSRLTLIRLTLIRKPWAFGVGVPTPIVVTHAYIFVSGRSSAPRGTPSARTGMLPYHARKQIARVPGFGGGLDARSSSTRLRSTSELLRTL